MQNHYLAGDLWQRLAADLVKAADHPVDAESAVKEVLSCAGIMPECCREDCENVVQIAA